MGPPRDERIIVSVPARGEFVQVLRAVTASVAARIPISFDGIEDLRLAVDEACAHLLGLRNDPTILTLGLLPLTDGLEAVVSVDVRGGNDWPPAGIEETMAWRILSALVDSVRLESGPSGPSITMSKGAIPASVPPA